MWCSHSNLSSVLESLKSIGNYITVPIDELILESNYLPSLPGRAFAPLKILRLMLRHNSLERVSTDWLANLESSLMELFLVEPKLTSLPQTSLESLKKLKAVTIRSGLLKRLPMFSGLPLLRYVQIESSSLVELAPSNFKDNPSLEKLHIQSGARLSRLQANLFDNLPKLELINITRCGINWIHPRTFRRLPHLKELSLIGNKITDPGMVGRASRELPELEILRLDYNYVGTIDEASFVDMPAIKDIFLSNNVIGEIRKGAFHRLPVLKKLDLSRNMLRRIQRQSFLQPIGLEELNLNHNDITDVIHVRSVLEDLPKLIYLDLSYNKLDAITFGSLTGHSALEQLNLGYNKLQHIDKEAFVLMPALRELILTNNSVIDNLRVPFWNLPALKGLDMSQNYLKRLEHNLLDNVGMLRRVDLSSNHLNFIDPESFLPASLLEHVNISSNNLNFLHPITFRHLTQLYELDASRNRLRNLIPGLPGNVEHLHLRHNEISKISTEDLHLPALRLLDLSDNKIQSLDEGRLRSLGKLKKLYLRSNYMRHVSEKALDGLLQLEILDISDNRISEINPLSMKFVTELKILNMANNQLSLIGPSLLSHAKNLRKFNASNNQLAEVLPHTFDANQNLQEVDFSINLIVQFPGSLYGLEKLKKLDLSRNRLKSINSTIVSSLTDLREIKLSKNYVQILEADTFNHLRHLKAIYLDDNEISLVESNFIKMLPSLKSIHLNRNQIEQLPSYAFNTLLSLQNVELQENKLRFIDPQAFHLVPQLLTLNLTHNEIYNIEDVGLKSIKSLELLDVSFNKITKLRSNLDDLEWLVELRLQNNLICEVDEGVFGNVPRLKVLNLKNNKLLSFPEVAVDRLRENTAQLQVTGNPLDCSCDMLWLKSWLRESSQTSPRCSDGTLLREMPLTPVDCPAGRRRERVSTGCEAEFLGAPNMNQQLLSKYASLRNFSTAGKNNLPPNPQESEYFYDDYIDYPFNASALGANEKDNSHIVERIPLVTKETEANTTGNVPVLYAASSKQKQPEIPAKIPDSPSTSGFTFFGIPLPALNLNNIFSKKLDQTTPRQVDRKSAVVNGIKIDKRLPVTQIGVRSQSMPSLQTNNGDLDVGRLQPPAGPQFQGGFLPMLPGSGGFKPMVDPRITTTIATVNTSPIISTDPSDKQPQVQQKNETSLDKRGYNLELAANGSSLIVSLDDTTIINNRNKKSQLVDKLNQTKLDTSANVQFYNRSEVHYLESISTVSSTTKHPEMKQTTVSTTISTTRKVEITTTAKPVEKTKSGTWTATDTSLIGSDTKVSKITSVETQIKTFESKGVSTTTIEPKLDQPKGHRNRTGSLLSTFLAPVDQQPYLKPVAKSTITKVVSPHGTDSTSALEISHASRLPANLPDDPTLEEGIITSTEDSSGNDWYFENYNKKNLEPFVAKIVNTSGSGGTRGEQVAGMLWLLVIVNFL
ncbi:unnamed protein product [Phyllotreta striolata]|uniref:LRRCT domain-containing protein n=1 Tax=Phyllotreta striolata TaxID=444603 RepID=A0A9N9XH38_PHYSR|nr:unnamed protein product [Phyllotreta striolata]